MFTPPARTFYKKGPEPALNQNYQESIWARHPKRATSKLERPYNAMIGNACGVGIGYPIL